MPKLAISVPASKPKAFNTVKERSSFPADSNRARSSPQTGSGRQLLKLLLGQGFTNASASARADVDPVCNLE